MIFLFSRINVCNILSSNSDIASLLISFILLIDVINFSPKSISMLSVLNTVLPSFDNCSFILSAVIPAFCAFSGIFPIFSTVIPVILSFTHIDIGIFSFIINLQSIGLLIFSLLDTCSISLFKLIDTVLYTLSPACILPFILPTVTVCPTLPNLMLLLPIINSEILQEPSFIAILSPRFKSLSNFNFTYPLFGL